MKRLLRVFLVTTICIFHNAYAQKTTGLITGPSPCNVELRTAQVWLQVSADIKNVVLKYWKKGDDKSAKIITYGRELGREFNNIKMSMSALEPNTTYQYHFVLNGNVVAASTGEFKTQDLWQYRKPAPDFSFLAGSCAYFNEAKYDRPGKPYGGDSSIFETMAKEKAAFMLWLGDNWYTRESDFYSEWGLNYRASRDRSLSVLQPFWKAMSHYAIWDDHDYGPNNADKSFILKEASRRVFMNNWNNPSFGEKDQGIYTKFTYNDVEFFLLDDRWFRSNDITPDSINGQPNTNKKMFGEQQMEWFKNAMRQSQDNSNVSFRIIATGSQVLNPLSPGDCFRHYFAEYKEMMDFLQDENINGVVFLTGDRHLSEINKVNRNGLYPLYDITASPLTAGFSAYSPAEKNNVARVLSVENKQNYARINVSGTKENRKLLIEFLGLQGERLAQVQILQKEISNKK